MVSEDRISLMFENLGARRVLTYGGKCYEKNGVYYKLSYVEGLAAYVIEYAETEEDAQKNLFSDGENYPANMNDEQIIAECEKDLKELYFQVNTLNDFYMVLKYQQQYNRLYTNGLFGCNISFNIVKLDINTLGKKVKGSQKIHFVED